jgi:hypothetical protein
MELQTMKWRLIGGLLLLLLPAESGCGYRVASKNRIDSPVQKVAVIPLENSTTKYQVEQYLTRALVAEFVRVTSYEIVTDSTGADAVLEGRIAQVDVNPVTFAKSSFGSTFLVTLRARIQFRERETDRILFQNDNFIFREQYVVNVDVENFFSEINPALHRISDDFASSIVSSILEDF